VDDGALVGAGSVWLDLEHSFWIHALFMEHAHPSYAHISKYFRCQIVVCWSFYDHGLAVFYPFSSQIERHPPPPLTSLPFSTLTKPNSTKNFLELFLHE